MGQLTQSIPYQELTTTERDALTNVVKDFIIYNTTTTQYECWDGSSWVLVLDKTYVDLQLNELESLAIAYAVAL